MKILYLLPVIAALALGSTIGLVVYTFSFAKGASYLSNDPKACANCHIMFEYYDAWEKSSHRAVAVCNDCHAPHDFLGKYLTKALNGFNHSVAFTFGTYQDNLRATNLNSKIAEASCRHCHQSIVSAIEAHGDRDGDTNCMRCHGAVGHPH